MREYEGDERLIYHVFADDGVESESLDPYGRVVRFGLDCRENGHSEAVNADAHALPVNVKADLAVLHPQCHKWAQATRHIENREEKYPDDIALAREIGEEYADNYIIENVPKAPLDPDETVTLNGYMFHLPITMERSFETSFDVRQPPEREKPPEWISWWDEYTLPKEYWGAIKGYENDHRKDPLVKSGIPRPYMDYLLRAWLREVHGITAGYDPDVEEDTRRGAEVEGGLSRWTSADAAGGDD